VLFEVPELAAGAEHAGPVEAGLRAALAAATAPDRDGQLGPLEAGLVAAALTGARALDRADRLGARDAKAGGYLVVGLLTPYRETLAALGLPAPVEPVASGPGAVPGAPDWGSVFGAAE